jgi:DNA polymerase III delta subunit
MPRSVVIARDPLIAAEGVAAKLPQDVPVERHFAAELNVEKVFNHLGSSDLFATRKVFHYVDFLDLKLNKAEGERLEEILAHIPEETTLICSQVIDVETKSEEERILKKQDYLRFTEGVKVDDLRSVADGVRFPKWLQVRAKERYGLVLSAAQADRLVWASGDRPALAESELQKLAAFKRDDRPQSIPDELFNATLSLNPAAQFYHLADAILERHPDAQAMFAEWYRLEAEPHRLIGELRRRLLGLLALERGEKVMPPFMERQLRGVQARWPRAKLHQAIQLLVETEHILKTGRTMGESSEDSALSALQMFIAQA